MINLPGYRLLTPIYESANSLVYRSIREEGNQPVVLKVLKEDYPTPSELTRYRQEYEITRNLNLDGVVKAYALEPYQRSLVIVLEDFGATSLEQLMDNSLGAKQFSHLPKFLDIAIKTAEILGSIHSSNIIHKDINPSNIVLNPETGQLKIIDFGISTVLTSENPTLKNPHVLEGTLAYMSPEQTGRMNRSLDYRTDFYSLGVTFYELLTGRLPFVINDALELVHCHIAKQPVPPHQLNPQIPKILSDIVMKLMAKTSLERYQSAWGIKTDLEICLNQLQTTGIIESFSLGSNDISDKFQISQKLYGREAEVATLLTAFERVACQTDSSSSSAIEMMLVTGYSGIGKSTLVQEIYQPITEKHGYFLTGKFDQFKRNIPYSAIVSACGGLVQQLLTETEAQLEQWREKLRRALGSNSQVIIDIIPEVELIVGKQSPVPELGAAESQNRFNFVFQNFIRTFCRKKHPLVIFLDDLQWADFASLQLIELMMTDADIRYLFLIGAYRDNEVNPTHPLMMTLERLRNLGATINPITLAPLAGEQIGQLIADTLHTDMAAVQPLADLVVRKTDGNPFFVNQFLKTLYAENLITFNHPQSFIPPTLLSQQGLPAVALNLPSRQQRSSGGYWQWNLAEIEATDITENVVELMIGQLQKLPESTQQVLCLAACIGAEFDLNTLSIICEKAPQEIFSYLVRAVQSGLILPTSELDNNLLIQDYKFLHDRVQQAAYVLIADEQQQAVHLKIGRLLLHNTSAEALSEEIFKIVDHLNFGVGLVTQQLERAEIAKLNLMAGQKAKSATAYSATVEYLNTGIKLLSADNWQNQYDLTLALHQEAAEAAYLKGDFVQMEQLAEEVLNHARNVLDKVKVYDSKIQAAVSQGKLKEAIKIGLQVLTQLGVSLPKNPSHWDIQRGLEETASLYAGREIEDLINLPSMTEAEPQAANYIMSSISFASYAAAPNLMLLLLLSQVNLSIKHGNATCSIFGYVGYGGLLCGVVQDIESGYKFGKLALNLVERLKATKTRAKVFEVFGLHVMFWKEHLKETLPILTEGYQSGVETGDFEFASGCAFAICNNSYFLGHELTKLEPKIAAYSKAISQLRRENYSNWTTTFWQAVLGLLQRSDNPRRLIGDVYNEEQALTRAIATNDRTEIYYLHLHKLILGYLFGEAHQAIKNAAIAEQYLDGVTSMIAVPLFHFYDSLAHLSIFVEASESEQKSFLARINANQEKMKLWAHHAPMNFLHKFHLVEAEKARVLGQNWQASELYEQAIQGANQYEYIQEEALAYELAGKFYLAHDRDKIGQTYLQEAHYTYTRWGAKAKVEDLEEEYPHFFTKRSSNSSNTISTNLTTNSKTSTELDLTSVLKASQTLSGEIELNILLEKMMQIVLENAGAQTGYLILPSQAEPGKEEGQWVIEASGKVVSNEFQVLPSIPMQTVDGSSDQLLLCEAIVNYVIRTQESVVLNDAIKDGNFTRTSYILKQQPKSVLCMPLLNQGKLIGILYLENNLTTEAFTKDRLAVLKILSSQAVISLENARLYAGVRESERLIANYSRTLENQVAERTEALRQSEERFREIAGTISQFFFVRSVNSGQFLYVSPAYEKIWGLTCESLYQNPQSWMEAVHPDDRQLVLDSLKKQLEGNAVRREYRIIRPDGSISWVVVDISVVRDQLKQPLRFVGMAEDITERKLVEAEIIRSRDLLKSIYDESADALFLVNPETLLIADCNQRAVELFEAPSKNELLNIQGNTLQKEPFALEDLNSIGDEVNLQGFWSRELEYVTKQGNLFWGNLAAKQIYIAGQAMHLVRVTDITARKQAEEKLRESKHFVERIAEASPYILYIYDLIENRNVYANREVTTILGYTSEQVQAMGENLIPTIFHPDDLAWVPEHMQRLAKTGEGEILEREYRVRNPQGEWCTFFGREMVFARTPDGKVKQIIGTAVDISDRKRVEIERQQAIEATDAANRAKSQFLTNMSHELRTPLNAIIGFSQLMSKSQNLAPEHQEKLKIIMRSGEHLLTLINQVLDLSKIEAGRITLNETAFDLLRLLDELHKMFQLKANSKRLQLVVDRTPDVPQYLRTDEVKLRQVLINLLSNAIKFTQEGGVVLRVSLGTRDEGHGRELLSDSGDEVENISLSPPPPHFPLFLHFEVADTGVGIAPEELDSLFEAFVQTQTGKQFPEGTGLGLPISQKFVQLMGGEITVESDVGCGSVFKFDIEVIVADATGIIAPPPPRRIVALEPNQQSYRILIVDDKPDNRQLLMQLLSPLGFKVKEASNGLEAFEVWSNWEPHLIWMDLRMPVMDGLEATTRIKSSPKGQATVIIALSAGTLEEEQAAALQAGCDGFVRKPFAEAEIFETMTQQIGVRFVEDEATFAPDTTSTKTVALNPTALAALPADLVANLHRATLEGDFDLMLTLIEQIRSRNDSLADALASLANNFQFNQLLVLTQPRDS